MDFKSIITAALSIGILGAALGAILAFASKIFHVEKDERIALVQECLPGANCGGCGQPGCGGAAEAIVKGTAPVNVCPVGGAEVAAKIAAIMGVEAVEGAKQVAFVACQGCREVAKDKFNYYGAKDCQEAAAVMGGEKACEYGCLGYGSCVKACKFGAIKVNEKGIAEVDPEKCTGCGACIAACPKGVVKFVTYGKAVKIACNSKDKGKNVKVNCEVGCISCNACVKNCPFEAITMVNNLPVIDYDKCRECLVCVSKCKPGVIVSSIERRKFTIKEENCIGCGLCAKNCPQEAISGEKKVPHVIDQEKCIGCGICFDKCKKDAIIKS